MTLVIDEKGSDAFYKEVVNVASQSRFIIKKHDYKIKDYFRQFRNLLIICCVFIVLLAAMVIAWGIKPLDISALLLLAVAAVFCAVYLYNLNKLWRGLSEEQGTTVITLDESAVEYNRDDSQVIRMTWEKIAVVKICSESVCFVPSDRSGILIFVDKKYADSVTEWLRQNRPDVEIS